MEQLDIEKFVREHGDVINGQITVAWYTRQTYGQLVEIVKDSAIDEDDLIITEEMFLDYLRSNTAEFIRNEVEHSQETWLTNEAVIVDSWAQVVEAE